MNNLRTKTNQILVAGIATALMFGILGNATNIFLQPAFAHALNIKDVEVDGAGNRGVTIVLGHTNEPAYGAKPGINDGKHGVEVFLEDRDTALPITGASLSIDKYYFADFKTFNKARSVNDATEIEKGVALSPVFGDPGHYVARQVIKDGIYGYRLYGTISYFSAGNLQVDSVVFCRSTEGDTSKFNSPGWFGGFGCPENINDILFPEKNNDVNVGKTIGKASFELPASPAAQVSTNVVAASVNSSPSDALVQLVAIVGLPAAAVAGVIGVKSLRKAKQE